MMRRIAVVGDELETGGHILAYAGPTFTFGDAGHQVALIGGLAFCAACESTGQIAKTGGPKRIEFMGETAADGDIVRCRCSTPPRIVAVLSGNSWCDDLAEAASVVFSGMNREGNVKTVAACVYDECVRATGNGASPDYPYIIETADGRVHSGRLDSTGYLPRIHTSGKDEYAIYWGDEALARSNGDV
ncbi:MULTISPECIES: PAAR domain-containing protein [unclassified Burkholderia]|uniref:PAAR domain-containing protein n=1 Tax=unclassified Burkholderia TaxID=2613784 RepID=UPI001E40DB1A|nr:MULTISPECIES: PAAR domain-containing protein [unclassified Burkholderia]UEP30403.1 PAAR domain-containing protein [Burkholderia sp. B21-007]UEP44281.1 PAAR domain-containing protein [Burkholderia sp. B21-005]